MSENQNAEYDPNAERVDDQREGTIKDGEARREQERAIREAEDAGRPGTGLPDEVLVDGPSKLAHEDTPVRSFKEAELAETRDGRDFEGAPSARDLRDREREERAEEREERREA